MSPEFRQEAGPLFIYQLLATASLWLVVALLWALGVLSAGASVVFMLAVATVAAFVAGAIMKLSRREDMWGSVMRGLILVLLVAVPVSFDPLTNDVFNLPRYTATVIGALVLAAVWAVHSVRQRRFSGWRNGLQWPVLALLAWTAITTATALRPRLSLLGGYGSYDGLFSALAMTVFFFTVTRVFTMDQVKTAISVLYFGAGGLVTLYGFIQLHDRVWSGPDWDWVAWGNSPTFSKESTIWSTLGNPNHLAGFLAILLPIGVVLLLVCRRWWVRAVITAIQAALILELLHTTTRGAWLAALGALVVVAVLLGAEIKRRPTIAFSLAGALMLVVVVAGLVLGPLSSLSSQLASAFELGGNSTGAQRLEFWRAGVKMANDRPLVGTGPDGYPSLFSSYQSPKLVGLHGPELSVNGPHNTVINYLATQGYPGMLAFLTLIAFAGLRAIGAWRRLRQFEHEDKGEDRDRARDARLALTALVAALVAYLIEASFNVQQIGLTFTFWALLGLTCVVARAAGVPDRLRPVLLTARPAPNDTLLPPSGSSGRTYGRGRPSGRRAVASATRGSSPPSVVAVGLAAIIALGIFVRLFPMVTAPYRADRNYRASLMHNAQAQAMGRSDPSKAQALAARSAREAQKAVTLNPWEPSYLRLLGAADFRLARQHRTGSTQQLAALENARSRYQRATDLAPRDQVLLQRYAEVLLTIGQVHPSKTTADAARTKGIAVLRQAVRANPYHPQLRDDLRRALAIPSRP